VKEGSSSFLKKRTKKLLLIKGSNRLATLNDPPDAMSKSFLVLFFKKELLPSFTGYKPLRLSAAPKLRRWDIYPVANVEHVTTGWVSRLIWTAPTC
jgi:hypothetical protein